VILDTSALVAIALGEPDHETLEAKVAAAEAVAVAAPTLVETGIVLS
jgi:ribonuclease VapC